MKRKREISQRARAYLRSLIFLSKDPRDDRRTSGRGTPQEDAIAAMAMSNGGSEEKTEALVGGTMRGSHLC